VVHQLSEDARISIRQGRHEAIDELKRMEKEKEISEDERIGKEKKMQESVDEYNKKVEELAKKKETDIMTV